MGFLSTNNGGRRWAAGGAVAALPSAARMLSFRGGRKRKEETFEDEDSSDSLSVDGLSDGNKGTGDNEQSEDTAETLQCGEAHHDVFYDKFPGGDGRNNESPGNDGGELALATKPEVALPSRRAAPDEAVASPSPALGTAAAEGPRDERFDRPPRTRTEAVDDEVHPVVPETPPRRDGGAKQLQSSSPPRPGPPPRLRSRSIRAKDPDEDDAAVDPHGGCSRHPFVELRRRSTRTGEWKALLDSCPICAQEDNNSSTAGGSIVVDVDSPPPKRVAPPAQQGRRQRRQEERQQEEQRQRPSRRHQVQEEEEQQRSRQRSRSCSKPRYRPVDTDDYVEEAAADGSPRRHRRSRGRSASRSSSSASSSDTSSSASWDAQDVEEDASSSSAPNDDDDAKKPFLWISCDDGHLLPPEEEDMSVTASEALAMTEDDADAAPSENDVLRSSASEAMRLAGGMGQKMEELMRAHEAAARDYEGRLAAMEEELARREGLAQATVSLREENEVLREMVIMGEEEMDESMEECRRECKAQMAKKEETYREELGKVTREREEAHRTCEVLQREVAMLQKQLKECKGGDARRSLEASPEVGGDEEGHDEKGLVEEFPDGFDDESSCSLEKLPNIGHENVSSLEEMPRGYVKTSLQLLEEVPKEHDEKASCPVVKYSPEGHEEESHCYSEDLSQACDDDDSFCPFENESAESNSKSYCSLEESWTGRDDKASRSLEESPKGVYDEMAHQMNGSSDAV